MDITRTSQFEKDIRKLKSSKNGQKVTSILKQEILPLLMNAQDLPERFKDHALIGDWLPAIECHTFPDTLLIYKIEKETLILVRIGSHAELFG